MNRIKRATLLLGILTVFFVSALALAQSGPSPLGIVPTPTPNPVSVSIWTDKTAYAIGENVTITYTVSQAAYIYILDFQPDGIVRQVFPNQYSTSSNYVSAGTHTLPDGMYKFTVYPPTGTEQLQIIASGVPLNLAPTSYSEPFPMVGSSPSAAAMSVQAQIKGITPEPQRATAWTSFVILTSYGSTPYTPPTPYTPYTPYTPPTPPSPPSGYYFYPPFPGSPGGTWYWQDGAWHYGLPASGMYWYFGPDMMWHFRITIHFGIGG